MPLAQTEQQRQATFQAAGQQPAAATTQPAPQIQSPVAPATININTAPVTPASEQNLTQGSPQQTGANAVSQATSGQLTAPANGSVVDLLNSAGQDSSFANRQKLAQQYGIQGYTGTAAQNSELSQKYLQAYNANKSTATPQTAASANSALNSYFDTNQPAEDPTRQFLDTYSSMNPIEANIFQQLSGLLSTTNNQQSLTDLYKQESAAQGLPELNMELADINKIMSGTEDDIRDEITNAGGFATESQVQALTGARNKNLLKQATYLSNVINAKNDYIDRIVSLTQADRTQMSKELDQKLGIANTLVTMSNNMENAARENYKMIVDSVGWEGLAQSVAGNAKQTKKIEDLLGLAPGELQTLSMTKKPLTEMEQAQLQGQQLQNQKLQQELSTGPSVSTQLANFGTASAPDYKLINSKTGAVIADYGSTAPSGTGPQQLSMQQQTITDTQSLLNSPGLNSAVGPNMLARGELPFIGGVTLDSFTGARSNFIAGVEQLRQQLTLDQLVNAKANGATFGALSDSELQLLSASASKIGTWAIRDKAGNVIGYNIDETDFKKELDKINNFQKLDFILKGGDPSSVGVQQMLDGTYWTENSDGSFTKIQ